MGLSAPAMAQEVNYKDMLKPIETTLKSGNSATKEFEKEIKEYQKEFKKDPKALIALGNILAMHKDYDKANLVADAVIAKFKNYGDAYILKGDIYAMQDNGGEAATWYNQCMTMDPKNPQGYISYSNVYRKIDPAASAEALNKLREINPDYPIEAEAGHNFFSAGNYEKAYDYFSKAKPSTLEEYLYYEYAFTAYILDKKEESLNLCQAGIQKFPKDAAMQVLAMRAAVDLRKYDVALEHSNIVMNTDSIKKNSSIISYYGLALAGNKQYNEAIAQYQKALEMKAEDPKPLLYISEAYKEMGDEDKALEYNQQYMDKNPDAAPTDFMKLAEIYINKAKKAAEAANKLHYPAPKRGSVCAAGCAPDHRSAEIYAVRASESVKNGLPQPACKPVAATKKTDKNIYCDTYPHYWLASNGGTVRIISLLIFFRYAIATIPLF